MQKKNFSILFIVLMFIVCIVFWVPHDKARIVVKVLSPCSFELDNNTIFTIKNLETFDSKFTAKNKMLAERIGITEEEAFVLGNLAKQKVTNILQGRRVYIKNNSDLIYFRYSFREKFLYSGFCLKNGLPYDNFSFQEKLKSVKKGKYKVLDLSSGNVYELNDKNILKLTNFLVVRKSHLGKIVNKLEINKPSNLLVQDNIKLILSDSTTQIYPTRNCSSDICKEILSSINSANRSIDLAIYGYSTVPQIEEALKLAIERGVRVRLVYDLDKKGNNIYPNTERLLRIINNLSNDGNSAEAQNIMHNKFYIFDDKILITGSANLSHTDMSGYNSNSIVKIDSEKLAKIYKNEFEQMFFGRYHNEKALIEKTEIKTKDCSIEVYFSPKDKALENAVIPLIKKARKYIYIPTFVLTEKRVTEELINAKNRGVEIKIIMDALNASIKHSKHNELRISGIQVKTENYAGKMHSKSMIVDDEYLIIGSMNFSSSAENKNDENLLLIRNSNISKFYKEFFLYQWNRIDNKWLNSNVRAEGKDSIGSCSDGIDNNYDGLIDLEDTACKS